MRVSTRVSAAPAVPSPPSVPGVDYDRVQFQDNEHSVSVRGYHRADGVAVIADDFERYRCHAR